MEEQKKLVSSVELSQNCDATPHLEAMDVSQKEVPSTVDNTLPDLTYVDAGANENGAKHAPFLQQTALLFEMARENQSRLVFLVSCVFIGLVVFTWQCMPMFTTTDQLQFGAFNPPQLAGEWVLNDVCDSPAPPHHTECKGVQHNLDLSAKGTDELGDFKIVGQLIPPNKIHLEKIHDSAQLHDRQVLDADLTLDSTPIYAHGTWTRAHAIDPSKDSLQAEGYWEANFYSQNPQPTFTKNGAENSLNSIMNVFGLRH